MTPFPVQREILSDISHHGNLIVRAEVDSQDANVTQSGHSKLKRMQEKYKTKPHFQFTLIRMATTKRIENSVSDNMEKLKSL